VYKEIIKECPKTYRATSRKHQG